MGALIRGGAITTDDWQLLADDAELPAGGKFIIDLARWQALAASAEAPQAELGLRLGNDLDVESLWPEIGHAKLIALEFPGAADGRAYSQARILRNRLGYRGEIRAVGAVIGDQLFEMSRCGFSAMELREDQDPETCLRLLQGFSASYQAAADQRRSVRRQRQGA